MDKYVEGAMLEGEKMKMANGDENNIWLIIGVGTMIVSLVAFFVAMGISEKVADAVAILCLLVVAGIIAVICIVGIASEIIEGLISLKYAIEDRGRKK